MNSNNHLLFNQLQEQQIEQLVETLNPAQLSWLAGYLSGISSSKKEVNGNAVKEKVPITVDSGTVVSEPETITLLFGSRTGNGESIAKKIREQGGKNGLKINLVDLNDYHASKIKEEKNLLIIVSTHGEGEPPIAAEDFYNYIHSKKAPKLNGIKYSVLALGDKSYVHFCKTGKDIDEKLTELGAECISPRVDCDVDFAAPSNEWINAVLNKFNNQNAAKPEVRINGHISSSETVQFNKHQPFKAKLLDKVKLTGRGSNKETYHYELSLEGSGIKYEPGDSLGVYGINSDQSVLELIDTVRLKTDDSVILGDDAISLKDALTRHFEISALSPEVVGNFNKILNNKELEGLLNNPAQLKEYIYGRDIVDFLKEYPIQLNAQQLTNNLRKLHPRLYSISSGNSSNPDEVHLTVSAVRYNNGRYKEGVCSSFLADRVGDEDVVRIYLEKNPEFRLPSNPETPVIMVGPGTGIAPFRAFLQEREATKAKGKNWLFFGEQHFTTDFLYQTELQAFHKKGILTKLNVAFSRDTDKKVYVQHRMLENSKELFKWLEEGAHFYVCGDMQHMWRDVNRTLIDIISKEGGMSIEKAEEYVKKLKKDRRLLTDVY